jgi:hypothetical protein
MIGYLIQDLVACFSRKNKRFGLHIFTDQVGRGETGNRHHPFLHQP